MVHPGPIALRLFPRRIPGRERWSPLGFSLSRIGATIGTLTILQDDGSGAFATTLMVYSGPDPAQTQGAVEWSSESVPFAPTANVAAFRFRYVAGGSFTGDLALDDVTVN